eukprot:2144222-Ditylum_brightwellii.AAC.1
MPYSVLVYTDDDQSATIVRHQCFLEEYGIVDCEPYIVQNGSKFNLFITFVDIKHAEKIGGMHGCDITFVQ